MFKMESVRIVAALLITFIGSEGLIEFPATDITLLPYYSYIMHFLHYYCYCIKYPKSCEFHFYKILQQQLNLEHQFLILYL